MTTESEHLPEKSFARSWLPWVVAVCALALYAVTLNHWVTAENTLLIGQIGNWDWQEVLSPVFFNAMHPPVYTLATWPLRWLPAASLPVALNLFSAVCATLTLMLLARSVALLPHDRTHDQREREKNEFGLLSIRSAWLPPVFAVLVCGLQLTFWENATAASSEMFDLLLFAYIVRCLLEFRIDGRDSWLMRCALVYGAAMTNNWAMISFFPCFAAVLVWLKGRAFFDSRWLVRIGLFGFCGLLFYFVMPAIISASPDSPAGFWKILRTELAGQRAYVVNMPYKSLLPLALFSILPLAIIGIRWAASFGDNTPMGSTIASLAFHVFHGAFFLVCIWVAFDPQFAPRRFPAQFGIQLPFLKLYFLGALAVGYFAGYFLLIFGKIVNRRGVQDSTPLLNLAATGIVWALLVLAPIGLFWKNLPQIQEARRSLIRDYGNLVVDSLPPGGAVVLTDDIRHLNFLKVALNERGLQEKYFVLNTGLLQLPQYYDYAKRKYRQNWDGFLPPGSKSVGSEPEAILFIQNLSRSQPVYYLEPSIGYYFEQFYKRPHGIIYELVPYPTNSIAAPPMPPEVVVQNDSFWANAEKSALPAVVGALNRPKIPREKGFAREFMLKFRLIRETDKNAAPMGDFYSLAFNYWGVARQQDGLWDGSGKYFSRALELNPDNIAAQVNLKFGENFRAGNKDPVPFTKSLEEEFGRYRTLQRVFNECGLFDEPNRCFEQSRIFATGHLARQAAQQLERVHTLAPGNLGVQLALMQFYSVYNYPDRVLKVVSELQPQIASGSIDQTNAMQIGYIEAVAHFKLKETSEGSVALQRVLKMFPDDEGLLIAATQLYLGAGDHRNALGVLDRHLKVDPDNASALVNKGFIAIQLRDFPTAVASLDRAISMQGTNRNELYYRALFNRAVAHLQNGNLDSAQKDYETLQKTFPTMWKVYYGLGEIAYAKKDFSAAIQNYQSYLSNSPPKNAENDLVIKRLAELKAR